MSSSKLLKLAVLGVATAATTLASPAFADQPTSHSCSGKTPSKADDLVPATTSDGKANYTSSSSTSTDQGQQAGSTQPQTKKQNQQPQQQSQAAHTCSGQ